MTGAVAVAVEPQDLVESIVVSPMRRRHLRGVLRIEEQANPRPWSMRLFASELRQPETRIYLVARKRHHVVGHAGAMLVLEDAHVTNVGVDPGHRREAVATRLMVALTRRAVAEGAKNMTLEVRASNHAAQGLYRRFGFAPAGIRTGYYAPPSGSAVDAEDALVMWVNDIDSTEHRDRLLAIENQLPTETILEGL